MKIRLRLVIDTNVLISATLFANSIPRQAFNQALQEGRILMSDATWEEVVKVLARRKFDRYVSVERRCAFIQDLDSVAELVIITQTVHVCRDPKDNMILELAINGEADPIITGDQDLLALDSFHGIPIRTPAQYLAQ